ncbi:hypothetical protein [Alkalihalophilus marmarensis]|uniref:hypothetical protein n=1 Tax=Alkalihalophilus marmarensis TaxID=521377 RepID=UPI002DB6A52E|nr:hypothetical protein [Alkalihalophilus marmarensis]MEC2070317.1 hypothetical protein [Alkalihalophilus marmarensis]
MGNVIFRKFQQTDATLRSGRSELDFDRSCKTFQLTKEEMSAVENGTKSMDEVLACKEEKIILLNETHFTKNSYEKLCRMGKSHKQMKELYGLSQKQFQNKLRAFKAGKGANQ